MNGEDTAAAWARARATGDLRLAPTDAAPPGMRRLVGPDPGPVWALPELPEGASPRTVTDLGLPLSTLERPTESAQVLACALRCCWPSPQEPIWPGRPARLDDVISMYLQVNRGKTADYARRAVLPALRRLDWTAWLQYRSGAELVRLGPQVGAWNDFDLNTLRDLWRMMPVPEGSGGHA
ncbi:hypothetical protein [Glycomyces sp. NPDC047010]|uniref:hypothetical protein n=1 Tax=Glycomyces sp. NPDC047010 TaxID=3155023 RepID=UPI0033CAB48C